MRFFQGVVAVATLVLLAGMATAQDERDHVFCYKVKQTKSVCAGGANEGVACRKDEECPSSTCEKIDKFGKTDATKKTYARIDDIVDPNNPQGLVPGEVPGVEFTYQVKKVKDFCVAADVDADGLTDADGSLVMYQIKQQKGECDGDPAVPCKKDSDCSEAGAGTLCTVYKETATPKFDKKDPTNLSVRVKDRYSDIRLDFAKEAMVMSPASFDATAHQGVPSGEEHYKCYAVKPTKKACSADAPQNPLGFCKGEEECGGVKKITEYCQKQPKFPKETHPNGLSASVVDPFQTDQDPNDPAKTFDLKKIKMFCQSAETELVGAAASLVNEPQAGLLCYQAKQAGGKCAPDSPENPLGSCKKEEQCGGEKKVTTFCQKKADPKFDKKDADTLGRYVEDAFFPHRLDVAKEDLLCVPACRDFDGFEFTDLLLKVSNLALGTGPGILSGLPRGVDVDGNPATWAPSSAAPDGIDNALEGLGAILNPLLQEEIDQGSISLLFQADQLANGPVTISGFLGELDDDPGCTAGDANNPPVDPGDPNDPCNYVIDTDGLIGGVRTTCTEEPLITLGVNVAGAESAPTATASGGGPGNNFTLDVSFGGASFAITAANVIVAAELTHDTTDVTEISGVLGGAVNKAELLSAISSLENQCIGGSNDGATCTGAGDCPGGGCQLADGIPFDSASLATFVDFSFPADIDLDNDSTPESLSIGLTFAGTEAIRTGAAAIDN